MEKFLEINNRSLSRNKRQYVYILLPGIAMQWINHAEKGKIVLAEDNGKKFLIIEGI